MAKKIYLSAAAHVTDNPTKCPVKCGENIHCNAYMDLLESRLVALGIQMLQVVVSLIPGEVVEVGMGYAFGAIEGTLLCLVGVALASTVVFLLVKTWGLRAVELFVSREKIDSLRFIRSEKRLRRTVAKLILLIVLLVGVVAALGGLAAQLYEEGEKKVWPGQNYFTATEATTEATVETTLPDDGIAG